MFLGLWGHMRKRREEKKKELERIAAEKRELSQDHAAAAWAQLEKAKEDLRQKQYQQHLSDLAVSSLDERRAQMQSTLIHRRAYLVDSQRQTSVPISDTDCAMIAVQNLIQSAQESVSSKCGQTSGDSGSSAGSCGSD